MFPPQLLSRFVLEKLKSALATHTTREKASELAGSGSSKACATAAMAEKERKHAHLTTEELAEFREIFNLVDLDKVSTRAESTVAAMCSAAF